MLRRVLPVLLALTCSPQLVFAQTAEERKIARSNAQSGAEAFEAGDFAKAIELLNRAESLVHAPTHLLLIGRAYVKLGKLADARESYLLVINERMPESASDAFVEAQQAAADEIALLEPRIPRATIKVAGAEGAELKIALDGKPFSHLALDVDTPVNPGKHLIEVTAPGKRPARKEWSIEEGQSTELELVLEDDPDAPTTGTVDLSNSPDASSWQRPVGWTAVGVGGAALIFGGISAAITASERSSLQENGCSGDTCVPGTDLSKFHTFRTLSTAGFITGGVLAAAGITLVLTAPTPEETVSVSPYLGIDSFGLKGRF